MDHQHLALHHERRAFLTRVLAGVAAVPAVAALAQLPAAEAPAPAAPPVRKVRLGLVGCGGRGSWIARHFMKHGGYEPWAVADYFQAVADKCGDAIGVDKARRFAGLDGYKKLIASGVEAIAIEDIPYFYPEQATAAVAAGLHVYMAKPVAVDVPGVLAIGAQGVEATRRKQVFRVDYQMPTDPVNSAIAERIRKGDLGPVAQIETLGCGSGVNDPPRTACIADRFQGLQWLGDNALGCGQIGNFDIHAIDTAIWIMGKRPVAVSGSAIQRRKEPHGDCRDTYSLVYAFDDGTAWIHRGTHLPNNQDGALRCTVFGRDAHAVLNYWGKSFIRGGPGHMGGKEVVSLYDQGAIRNIAAFHADVCAGVCGNETVQRSVDSTLACILGREAGERGTPMTMEELIRENRRLTVDLSGLKA